MKEKVTWKHIVALQAAVILYSVASMMAKFASAQSAQSLRFWIFFGLDVLLLGVYAILWQRLIRRFDLSVAYANRAMALLWSVLWSTLIFRERLTFKKAVGVLLVLAGTLIVNLDQANEERQALASCPSGADASLEKEEGKEDV